MSLRNYLIGILLICFALINCDKKKGDQTLEDLNVDNTEIETADTDDESDDIFDEFYEDENKPTEEQKAQPNLDKKAPVSSSAASASFDPNGRYAVQVSCVVSSNYAKKIAAKLENKGYPTYIAEVENPTPELPGLYYRIRIGGFTTYNRAKLFAENYLVHDGYEFWVDNRANDNVGFSGSGLGTNASKREYEAAKPASSTPVANVAPQKAAKTETAKTPTPKPQTKTEPKPQVVETSGENATKQPANENVASPEKKEIPSSTTTPSSSSDTTSSVEEDEWGDIDDEWGTDTTDW